MPVSITRDGSILNVPSASVYEEAARLGQLWAKTSDSAACIAAALPTTSAAHTFWNGNAVGGKSAVVEAVAWTCLTTEAAATMFNIWAMLDVSADTAQAATADTATKVSSLSGITTYTGGITSSHTVTVVNGGWFPLGTHIWSAALTATKGATIFVPINGMIVIRPGHALAISIGCVDTIAAGMTTLFWREKQLTMQG